MSRTPTVATIATAALLGLAGAACHRDEDPPKQASVPAATATGADAAGQAVTAALARYETVGRQGTPAEKCTQAGLVLAAQEAAHNAYAAAEWKAQQAADCAATVSPALSAT